MVTYCHKCNRVIVDEDKDFLLCKLCSAFTPRNILKTKLIKGGNKMEVDSKQDVPIKKRKYSDEINATIIAFSDSGKSIAAIAKHFNNRPGKPYIARVLTANKNDKK